MFGEKLHTRHGDDARTDAVSLQQIARREGDFDLGTGGHDDCLTLVIRIGQHVATLCGKVLCLVL